jgi:tetratricopeptide (TPR) repeat protein
LSLFPKFLRFTSCLTVALLAFAFPALGNTRDLDKEIEKTYLNSDFARTVELLERKTEELRKTSLGNQKPSFRELHQSRLLLAFIYAWKLNEPQKAAQIYNELIQHQGVPDTKGKMPAFEFLFLADLHQHQKDYPSAKRHYHLFLEHLTEFRKTENDDVSIILVDELTRFTKYQFDTLVLKTAKERPSLLLPELRLVSLMTPYVAPFLSAATAPAARYETSIAMACGLAPYLEKSTTDVGSMFLGYSLLLNAAGGKVEESSERAFEVFLNKYPDSYLALSLANLFYQYYKESEQPEKAERLREEINKTADRRRMNLIIGPDEMFSSPERTWETYRKALMTGDLDLAISCHLPGDKKYSEIFRLMGKEKMKEVADKMGPIEKITGDATMAKYRITRDQDGKEITYYIYFSNMNGEWKIVQY